MQSRDRFLSLRRVLVGAGLLLAAASPAVAQLDLTVSAIQVNQGVQFGTTRLIANNATWVRVSVGTGGQTVPLVDARLRLFVNGVESPNSPVYSLNGPITAPANPDLNNINHTLNFMILAPASNDVDIYIDVNPFQRVTEFNYSNNTSSTLNRQFLCRKVVEMAYVPINYTGGSPMGTPDPALIEPGIGDGFIRGIYRVGEWNYHKSPTPTLNWTQPINSSSSQLLTALRNVRITQIPALGYPQPDFVYGWMLGNPFSGNGQAIGIPGDVGHGNTDVTRHQRTSAHELGHLWGLQHISGTILTIGVDVEWHLQQTQNIAQIQPTSKNDIMVAGLLTNQAWVRTQTNEQVLNDSRAQCPPSDALEYPDTPALIISGIIDNTTRVVTLDPVMAVERAVIDADNPLGDIAITGLDAEGNVLFTTRYLTGTTKYSCVGDGTIYPDSPIHVLVPAPAQDAALDRVVVTDTVTNATLAERVRSAHAPEVSNVRATAGVPQIEPDGRGGKPNPGAAIVGRVRVQWDAFDVDGDQLTHTVLYSPDLGASWVPVALNTTANAIEFDSAEVQETSGQSGLFAVETSDGVNTRRTISPVYALGTSSPPATFLVTPNNANTFFKYAPVLFHGVSWDLLDRRLTGNSLEWTSSIDGPIGTGEIFIKKNLSVGAHTITVTGRDSSNLTSSRSIQITILNRVLNDADFNNDGIVNAADLGILLGGWGNPTSIADLNLDGTVNAADLGILLGAWGTAG